MSPQGSSTSHSSTSPWLLLGIGVGAGVLGAAGAAAVVLYLQKRQAAHSSAPAPAPQAPAGHPADVTGEESAPVANAKLAFPVNSISPPAMPTLPAEPAAASGRPPLPAVPSMDAGARSMDDAASDWRASSLFGGSDASSARCTPQLGTGSARCTPQQAQPSTRGTSGGLPLGARASGWPSHDGSTGGDSCKDSLRSLPNVLRDRSAGSGVGSLELGALLGRGSFGKVYKGRWKGAMVAVKVIEHNENVASKLEGLRESVLSANIQHPNVLSTYKVIRRGAKCEDISSPGRGSKDSASGAAGHHPSDGDVAPGDCFEDAQETWMLSEFCDRGNLDRAISANRFKNADGTPNMLKRMLQYVKLTCELVAGVQTTICRSLIDVAAAMDYLHSIGVLHCDLKGGNVLLKSTATFDDPRGFICKVGDFGLSRVLETNSTHVSTNSYGTVAYMPAEMLKDGKMTKAVDVYSFAIIMLELFMGDMVFRGMSSSQVFFKVLMGYRPPVPDCMPQGFKDLLEACWAEDPANRPPFEDIVAWLRKLYYSSDGAGRDNRRSLDLNPWATN